MLRPLASAMLPEAAPFVAYVTGAHHSARLLQCVNEPELDLSGLGDAIKDFSLNNPAVKAPSRRLKLGFWCRVERLI